MADDAWSQPMPGRRRQEQLQLRAQLLSCSTFSYLLVELLGLTQNGLTAAANTQRDVKFRRQIKLMCEGSVTNVTPPCHLQVLFKASCR
jgi:hypothetical protein